MLKLVIANLATLLVLPLSAFAADATCAGYNQYVTHQCASEKTLKGDLSDEMLKGYSVKTCKNESFKMILESDLVAKASCKPVMSGKLISALN
ncbi:hypothetical protein AZI86_15355 [Bdellovibrio bacteriovorus]|uniref:Uncharacterized protein n=1 Tax=Bdellovibrio bacteriovorus TaxID=959 RepID=A0A150WI41_BDEBC|nr:hypothetical protein [Bdellovibrio bacteriovorus]KYG63095.1 hypothetical protein AZI86_15355 [Bdellovibrio bacteriovorus]